ncbi:hypothetical protein MRX96_040919 [Rhipicephalus microplus]
MFVCCDDVDSDAWPRQYEEAAGDDDYSAATSEEPVMMIVAEKEHGPREKRSERGTRGHQRRQFVELLVAPVVCCSSDLLRMLRRCRDPVLGSSARQRPAALAA